MHVVTHLGRSEWLHPRASRGQDEEGGLSEHRERGPVAPRSSTRMYEDGVNRDEGDRAVFLPLIQLGWLLLGGLLQVHRCWALGVVS